MNRSRSQKRCLWAKQARQRVPSLPVLVLVLVLVFFGRTSLLLCSCLGVQERLPTVRGEEGLTCREVWEFIHILLIAKALGSLHLLIDDR